MRIISFTSVGGASGDMLLGALIGLGAPIDELNSRLQGLVPDEEFTIEAKPFDSHGMQGIQAKVAIHTHSHAHRHFTDIRDMIQASNLPQTVKESSIAVFLRLAEAEAGIHGTDIDHVHFHEVGAVDSIVDIVGSCLAMELLGIDAITCSPLPLGTGTFTCQHGTYPLPAPATLALLKDFPVSQTDQPFELVTPTGAALLTTWQRYEGAASGTPKATAYSFGQRELNNRPNLLRASLLETAENAASSHCTVLECNLDDMTPELIGIATNKLLAEGALDVFTTAITMKKQRPGIMLTVLCQPEQAETFRTLMLTETTTFGVREYLTTRTMLERHFSEVETEYGTIRIKIGSRNGIVITRAPEISDCEAKAGTAGVPVKSVYQAALSALS